MKPITLLLIAGLLPLLLYAQAEQHAASFSITGKIKGKRHGYIYLDYPRQGGQWRIDSCAIQQRRFSFTGNINEATLATLRIGKRFCADDDANAAGLYIEPRNITVAVRRNHAKEMRVMGSTMQVEKDSLDRVFAKIINSGHDIANRISAATTGFIVSHPQSSVSAFQLNLYSTIWDVDTVLSLYNKLGPNIQNSFYGNNIKKIKDAIGDNSEGKPAKNFVAADINGAGIQLSSFKGKPILLDFWASWCLPCRDAIPHIKMLYSRYHGKGLEIISISCDDDVKAWKKAVEKDSTSIWHNVLGNYKNGVTTTNNLPPYIKDIYAVYGIPVIVIIDKNGIIAGRYTGDDEQTTKDIDEKLKEVVQ